MADYDLAIVGGGPAGASAATFAARAGLRTLVIDADKGMTRRALLNNHLGFAEGISGPDLVDAGRAQAERAGAEWREGTVESLATGDDGIVLTAGGDATFTATEVLLTIGANVGLAADAGIETRPGTEPYIKAVIATDGEGRTSVPGVWGAGTASGVTFITLEDETGHVNLILWRKNAEEQREVLLNARLMGVQGELQIEGKVIHVIVHRMIDHSRLLGDLMVPSREFR